MMKRLILVALLSLASWSNAETPARFVQDQFAIGFWVDPPVEEQTEARYREMAGAGFNTVIGARANTPELISRQLDYCAQFGMKAIIARPATAMEEWPEEHSALWGYGLRDEPGAKNFPELGALVEELRKKRPGKLGLINLFPTYASEEQLGTASYEEHVAGYMATVKPDVLCMDHYPYFRGENDTRDAYCENLEYMRRHSQGAGVPFWNFFNIMPFGNHDDPTEAQVRWQAFASLCYGAKGLMYFCYWTPRGDEFPKGGAIITAEGRRTRHYGEAQRLNARVQKLGPTLMKLRSTGVVRLPRGSSYDAALKDTMIEEISEGDYLVGGFEHEDGRRGVMLMNYEYAHSSWPTVAFAGEETVEVDQGTGDEVAAIDDSPDMEGLQVSLDAGEARLFLIKR